MARITGAADRHTGNGGDSSLNTPSRSDNASGFHNLEDPESPPHPRYLSAARQGYGSASSG